jgi:hypothetical protein
MMETRQHDPASGEAWRAAKPAEVANAARGLCREAKPAERAPVTPLACLRHDV